MPHVAMGSGMGWEEVDPRGIIYSWQRPWHPVHPTLKDFGPYVTVLVELPQAGGVRMIGNLIEDARTDVQIGRKVTGYFERQDRDDWLHLLHWKYA